MYGVWSFHFYQIWNNSTGRFSVTSRGHVTRFYYGRKYFFLQIWSCYIPLESCCYADPESYENIGLKMKWSRDITVWNLSRDVTWPFSNQNIPWVLRFHTLFLIWFWISLTRAFQRYIIWPTLTKKKNSLWATWWWRLIGENYFLTLKPFLARHRLIIN